MPTSLRFSQGLINSPGTARGRALSREARAPPPPPRPGGGGGPAPNPAREKGAQEEGLVCLFGRSAGSKDEQARHVLILFHAGDKPCQFQLPSLPQEHSLAALRQHRAAVSL